MENKIKKIINFLEQGKFKFEFWLISFLTLISTRLLIESILLKFPQRNLESFISLFVHTFLFFILTYLVFLFFLYFLTQEKIQKIAHFLLWGFIIIIVPPIIDRIIFQDNYKSFYLFDSFQGLIVRFFTFFGKNPNWGITWGTRINILISIFSLGGYVYFKTKNLKKTFISIFGSYFLFFLLSSFPSLIVFGLEFFKTGSFLDVSYSTVAGYFLSPLNIFNLKTVVLESFLPRKLALIYLPFIFLFLTIFCFKLNFTKTISLIKNIRPAQLIFNLGILFIGMGLGWFYYSQSLRVDFFTILVIVNLILVVASSWVFSVVTNDFNDLEIDKISNSQRPLVDKKILKQEYKIFGWFNLLFSLLGSILISPVVFLIVLSYHFLTFVYSCYPFRLRRFIGISNLLISLSSLNFLIIGFLIFSENQILENFNWKIYWFLFLAYLLMSPLKDLKDFKGDKKNKIITLPTLIGKEKTRLLMAGLLFSLYLSSVYLLREPKLFLPALLIGSASFFVTENQKIKEKYLNYWVLGLVFIYGICLVKIIFMK